MIGVEIKNTAGVPAHDLRDRIIDHAFHRGLLLLPCGASTIRVCPPLCLTSRQVEIGLELLANAFAATLEESHHVTDHTDGVAPLV
jgi:4-aminobutyrate aminotransferase